MELIAILLDVLIVFLSLWILFKLKGYGGLIGESLTKVGYGTVILGFSQIIETANTDFFPIDSSTMEMIHHVIFIIGLSLLALGFKRLMEGK
ncbi:MAG: hypothetical protein PHD04_03760 [Candidatus Pacebacteria bacterium]|nr:hypothetical protein [Candidatus Paceibacterota bacterium]